MTRRRLRTLPCLATLLATTLAAGAAGPARAVLDINDRGPTLDPGNLSLRVTNAGILGNAFYDVGLSSDPSFEFPARSGQEVLNYAALWVGSRSRAGDIRVSGGPILEWRPTLDPRDRVLEIAQGRLGARRMVDDDGDGRLDEEILNGRDDDGDFEIDEDLALVSKEMLAADYVDDRPEAASYIYEGGEAHRPMGLSVHQEVYGWGTPGYDGMAGIQFRIANHGTEILQDLYVGFFADLDSRRRAERSGHLDDRVVTIDVARTLSQGSTVIEAHAGPKVFPCIKTVRRSLPALLDGSAASRLPAVTVVPLSRTHDPLANLRPAAQHAWAPGVADCGGDCVPDPHPEFRTAVFSRSRVPGQGGVPSLDAQRYAAMAGLLEPSPSNLPDDYVVLVSCGPFRSLAPGQSIEFAVALVAAPDLDSLALAAANAIHAHSGTTVNLVPDQFGENPRLWIEGTSGINGHESCIEAPPGVTFLHDPHCPAKMVDDAGVAPPEMPDRYQHGRCIWTDADCDACTGAGGRETVLRWLDPGALPPAPNLRRVPLDHAVRLEWDNLAEVLIEAGLAGRPGFTFQGYRVYKLSVWRGRQSLVPADASWSLLAAFGPDSARGERPLATVIDTTVAPERILYRQPLYPIGRYRLTDARILNGFDYFYVVTTVTEIRRSSTEVERYESPLVAFFDQRVTPQAESRPAAGAVWVVPNPFRARAHWDRPAIGGDGFTRHIDFMGLPRARATIKIWTAAGDLVQQLDHDGSGGDGQAAWDLVSRSGQDVESGIYLFTVESPLGRQTGRFVVIR